MINVTKIRLSPISRIVIANYTRSIYSYAFKNNKMKSRFWTPLYPSNDLFKKNLCSIINSAQVPIPKQESTLGSSSLRSALAKLAGSKEKGIPSIEFEDLPKDRSDPLWEEIRNTYGLELSELSALKNYVMTPATSAPPPASTTPLSPDLEHAMDDWFHKVFNNCQPHSAYLSQDDPYIGGSLFSSHHKDMSSKLIGFDLPAGIQIIDKNLRIPRSAGRGKNVIGTVRGAGAGKTRILEELRQHYLKTPEVLIISITFNSNWKIMELQEVSTSEHQEVCLAIALIARMASVFYNIKLINILKEIQKYNVKFLSPLEVDLFIRRFIQFIVNQVRLKRIVKKFILVVDEPMKLEKVLNKQKVSDFFYPIRGALLDESLDGVFDDLDTALIFSSLDPNPFGKTETGSGITLLPPTKITGEMIVNNWWIGTGFVGKELMKLTAFATLGSPLPRLTEFGYEFIKNEFADAKGRPLQCNDLFFGRMLEFIDAGIKDRYEADMIAIPSVEVLYDMIYRYPIDISIAKSLIRSSVLTNQIRSIKRPLSDPIICIQMLYRSLKVSRDFSSVAISFSNIISEVKFIGKFEGHSLEVFFREWFFVRTSLALANPQNEMSIGTLLGFNDTNHKKSLIGEAFEWLTKSIEIPKKVAFDQVETVEESLKQNSSISFYESSKSYYKMLKSKFPSMKSPVILLICAAGDHQDGILMTYSGNVDKPDILALDFKSLSDTPPKSKSTQYFPGNNHNKWKLFCQINDLPFKFIYLTTHEGDTYCREEVLVIRRPITSAFLSSLWETYLATRAVDEYTAPEASLEKKTVPDDLTE